MIITCDFCGNKKERMTGEVNRAKKNNRPIYCDRKCAGLANRSNKTKAQLVEEKRLYDIEYRAKNAKILKAKKRAYFKKTYDPVKAAVVRKKNMHRHVKYCRTPKYKAWKKKYDQKYRAKKQFGEYYESAIVLIELDNEIREKESFTERATRKGTLNKKQTRRRKYERLEC